MVNKEIELLNQIPKEGDKDCMLSREGILRQNKKIKTVVRALTIEHYFIQRQNA